MAHRGTVRTARPRTARLLADDLLVLSLDPATGRPRGGLAAVNCGLAGALLAELALSGRLQVERSRVMGAQPAPGGDAALADVAGAIAADSRRRPLTYWVHKVQGRKLRRRLLRRAVDTGVLRAQRRPGPLGVPVTRYTAADPAGEAVRAEALRTAVHTGRVRDERTGALLALLAATGADARLLPGLTRSRRRSAIAAAVRCDATGGEVGTAVGRAVRSTVHQIRAALAVAIGAGLVRPILGA